VLVFALTLLIAVAGDARDAGSPAGAGSSYPFLFSDGDRLVMSWIEPAGERHAVRVATYRDGRWSAPVTVIERADLFVNWADFPSITSTNDGTLFVSFLQKRGSGKYSYDVHVSASQDGGRTWSEPKIVHRDGTESEHGFVSMVPVRDDAVGITWLDGREMTGHEHGGEMTLRYARLHAGGRMARESRLDARVCECCTTGMAMTSRGPIIVYRDRTADEIRDISIVRWNRGRWTEPVALHRDGWKIEGCPVNGPQVVANGSDVVVSWFTAAQNDERVYAAFSDDAGATFTRPVRIDSGSPIGRVALALSDDGSAIATWMETAAVFARRVGRDGAGAVMKIADADTSRSAGFPRTAVHAGELFVAWTEGKKVRLVALPRKNF
jgi:hypothetical protein